MRLEYSEAPNQRPSLHPSCIRWDKIEKGTTGQPPVFWPLGSLYDSGRCKAQTNFFANTPIPWRIGLSLELNVTVYIVVYRGTVYGVYDTREKATASVYGDLYDTEILEREVL